VGAYRFCIVISLSLSLSLFAPVADLLFVEEIPKRVVEVFVRVGNG
jgi:hypothetical protein